MKTDKVLQAAFRLQDLLYLLIQLLFKAGCINKENYHTALGNYSVSPRRKAVAVVMDGLLTFQELAEKPGSWIKRRYSMAALMRFLNGLALKAPEVDAAPIIPDVWQDRVAELSNLLNDWVAAEEQESGINQ